MTEIVSIVPKIKGHSTLDSGESRSDEVLLSYTIARCVSGGNRLKQDNRGHQAAQDWKYPENLYNPAHPASDN